MNLRNNAGVYYFQKKKYLEVDDFVDEDVPGGASSYILQQLIEKQNVFPLLDSAPKLVSAKAHRPAYGGDGDYFSKPSADDIFEAAYAIMHEANPSAFPTY